ncbi:hypothetical protein ABTK35_20465, partial [Acinetobacter baumannii]
DVRTGDYLEIGMLGAYGAAMRTAFNGFTNGATGVVEDEPMTSLYRDDAAEGIRANVVKL